MLIKYMSINILSLAAFGFSICMFTSIYEVRQKNYFQNIDVLKIQLHQNLN